MFTQFKNLPATDNGRKFFLSWSHYIKLMRTENVDERHFYEIEAVRNDWSLTELKGSLILRCMKGWHLAGIKKV